MHIKATAAVVLAAATLAAAAPATAAETPAPTQFSVEGAAGGKLPFPGWEGHTVRFTFDAHGVPGQTTGTFRVQHWLPDGVPFADFAGHVDCVSSLNGLAILTGVIDSGGVPGLPGTDVTGRRVGFSVQDMPRGHDRLGWSWAVGGFAADALPCTGPIPFMETSGRGGFVVR